MPARHLAEITTDQISAALSRWKAGSIVIEWLSDEPPPDAVKQTRRANVLCAGLDADKVWRVLDNESLKGDSPEDVVDAAVGICCEPEGMQPGTVLRSLEVTT